MPEIKETHVVKERGEGSGATPWLAFIVGALLVAIVAVFLLNSHGRVTGPSGSVEFNTRSPVALGPANPAPAK